MVSKVKMAETYKVKLNEIRAVMRDKPIADALGCSLRSIGYWSKDAGQMRVNMADKIDALHNRVVIK